MAIRKRIRSGKTRFEVKVYDPTVKSKQRWVGTFDTLRDAKLADAKATEAVSAGTTRKENRTVAEYAEVWLELKSPHIERTTYDHYDYSLGRLRGRFGSIRMRDVDREDARAWAQSVPETVRSVARNCYNQALEDGYVDRNPFANLRIPRSRGRADTIPFRTDSPAERLECLHRLADAATGVLNGTGPMMRALILFAAYTGMRPGEMFGLQWDDIDFEVGVIEVKRSITKKNSTKKPKNGRERTIVLPSVVVPVLESLPRLEGYPYVFYNAKGKRLVQPTLSQWWGPVKNVAGFPDMDFYELRHWCATYLLDRGVASEHVAIQLGHTDGGELVRKLYGHPSEEAAREHVRAAFG